MSDIVEIGSPPPLGDIPQKIFAYTIFRLAPIFSPGGNIFSTEIDRLLYWTSFSLSLVCLIYLSVETFWCYINKTGRAWNELNKNSYGVYIIHVIVMGVIAILLLSIPLPSLLKYLTLTLLTFLVSNLLISLYRRIVDSIRSRRSQSVLEYPGYFLPLDLINGICTSPGY